MTEEELEYYRREREREKKRKKEAKWISVKERLPEMGQTVVCAVYGTDLIVQEDGETFVDALRRNRKHAHIELGYLAEDGWNEWEGYPMIVSPSYWMPFPDIPMPEVGE